MDKTPNRIEQMKFVHIESEVLSLKQDKTAPNPFLDINNVFLLDKELKQQLNITKSKVELREIRKIREIVMKIHQESLKSIISITHKSRQDIRASALQLFSKKNADYGDAFAEYNVLGIIVRMGDKIFRLKTLTKRDDQQVKDESILDTLEDLFNYSAMAIMLIDE